MEMKKCLNVSDLCILLLDNKNNSHIKNLEVVKSLKRLPILALITETISDLSMYFKFLARFNRYLMTLILMKIKFKVIL